MYFDCELESAERQSGSFLSDSEGNNRAILSEVRPCMADINDKGEKQPERESIKAPDAQAARNAGVQDVKAAEAIRTNQSDGSLRKFAGMADQELSIELCYEDRVASRTQKVSEKELLTQVPKESLTEQSRTLEALESAAKTDPVADVALRFRRQAEAMEPGPDKDRLTKLAKEQAAEILAPRKQDDQEDCGIHEVPTGPLQGQVLYLEKEIEGVKRLTPDDLRKLAKAFEVAGPAGEASINQTAQEILVRTGESSRDTVLAGINLVLGVLKYDRDLLFNPEQAREEAGKAGEEVATLLVAGVQISTSTAGTIEQAKRSGDYSLPLTRVGAALNSWYEKQSPADQMAIVSEICAGFGIGAFTGEANKLRKPGAFAAFLQEGLDTLPRNPEAEKRALETLTGFFKAWEPLKQPTGIGSIEKAGVKWSEVARPIENGIEDLTAKMSPWFEKGTKRKLEGGSQRAAEITGLPEEQVKKLVKQDPDTLERLTGGKMIYMEHEYREIYLRTHPHYRTYLESFEVHHRIPQDLLKQHPDWFSHKEIHDSSNLVGIPKSTGAHKAINKAWKTFWRENENATKQQVLDFVKAIDTKYGANYLP